MSRDNPPRTPFQRHRSDFDLRDTGEQQADRDGRHVSGLASSLGDNLAHNLATNLASSTGHGDDRRQKVRVSAGSNPISDYPRIPTGVPTVTDTLQNTRMDEIERAIRALSEDMARNRSTFSALLGELRGGNGTYQPAPVFVPRSTNGHSQQHGEGADLALLIERVERNVEAKFNELARAWSVLGDRLGVLERAVDEIDAGDGRPIGLTPELDARLKTLAFTDDRLDKLDGLLTTLPQRFAELERRLQSAGGDGHSEKSTSVIISKIDQLERLVLENGGTGDDKNYNVIVNKIDQLERLVMEGGGQSDDKNYNVIVNKIDQLERLVMESGGQSDDKNYNVIVNKIDQLERLVMESGTSGDRLEMSPVLTSLKDVEAGLRGIGGQLREVDERSGDISLLVEGFGDRQKRMEDLIEGQQSLIEDLKLGLGDDFSAALVGRSDGADAISSSVGALVSERFAGLSNQLHGRMGQLEALLRNAVDREPTVINNSGDLDSGLLTDAMTKIINNQHTLASSIDEWRIQARDDFAALTTRIDRMEVAPVVAPELPYERFSEISERLDRIQSTLPTGTRQPVDGWSRFKLWLYGTDDWYAASWMEARDDDRGWMGTRQPAREPRRPVPNERGHGRDADDSQRA